MVATVFPAGVRTTSSSGTLGQGDVGEHAVGVQPGRDLHVRKRHQAGRRAGQHHVPGRVQDAVDDREFARPAAFVQMRGERALSARGAEGAFFAREQGEEAERFVGHFGPEFERGVFPGLGRDPADAERRSCGQLAVDERARPPNGFLSARGRAARRVREPERTQHPPACPQLFQLHGSRRRPLEGLVVDPARASELARYPEHLRGDLPPAAEREPYAPRRRNRPQLEPDRRPQAAARGMARRQAAFDGAHREFELFG